MAECAFLSTCIFFNDKMAQMPSTAEMYKQKYCRSQNQECARYQVLQALGRENVPPNLFPNHLERAKALIAGKDLS